MAKDFAKKFYNSNQWQKTREAYFISCNGLCERCLSKDKVIVGEIVHHKIYITPSNINDPSITLNWDNLELLCRPCHRKEHGGLDAIEEGYCFNEEGELIKDNT